MAELANIELTSPLGAHLFILEDGLWGQRWAGCTG